MKLFVFLAVQASFPIPFLLSDTILILGCGEEKNRYFVQLWGEMKWSYLSKDFRNGENMYDLLLPNQDRPVPAAFAFLGCNSQCVMSLRSSRPLGPHGPRWSAAKVKGSRQSRDQRISKYSICSVQNSLNNKC